jgi:hypothetical protein
VAAQLRRIVDAYPRDQFGPAAAALALDLIGRVARGEMKVRHAGDVAELVRVLADVARLEAGQPTSASVVAHLSSEDAAERLTRLQASARAALAAVNGRTSATAVVVADESTAEDVATDDPHP